MSDPIVIELQRLASDNACPVDELLRKALIVATKLKIEDFRTWINLELNGYASGREVPKYREATATVHVFNDVTRRLMPFFLPAEIEASFQRVPIIQPLANLVELASRVDTTFQLQIPVDVRNLLIAGQGQFPMEPVLQCSRIYISRAVDAVRNLILEWSLRLEAQGILGEGMRFNPEEQAKAMTSQNIHIGSFQGILGDVAGSTVTQNLDMTIKAGDFNSLGRQLAEAGVETADIKTLEDAIQVDPKPTSATNLGPKVSSWFGNMMAKAAGGTWKVSLDTAGKLIPAAIAAYYGLKG